MTYIYIYIYYTYIFQTKDRLYKVEVRKKYIETIVLYRKSTITYFLGNFSYFF